MVHWSDLKQKFWIHAAGGLAVLWFDTEAEALAALKHERQAAPN